MGIRPRLLIVSTTFPRWENDPGPAPFVFDLADHLQKYFEVTVLAPHFPGSARHEVWNGMEIFRFRYLPEKWEFLADGQGLQNHLRQRKSAWAALISFLLAEFFAGLRILRKRGFDAVNSHWLIPSGLIFSILCRPRRIPHIATVHAADYFQLSRMPAGKFMIRLIAGWSKALIPVNQTMADGIKKIRAGANLFIMPMGFEPEKFQHPDQGELGKMRKELALEDHPVLLFIGKLTEKKGVSNLIEALGLLLREFPKLKLLIAGKGLLLPGLEQQARNSGLSHQVKFLGAVPHQTAVLLYHLADAVVVPSIPDRYGESEGMPVVVLEGLAAGKPVIGTVYCSVPSELKQAGFFEIGESSPEAIARAVKKVLREGLKVDGEKVKKYSWPEVANFYAEVVKG